jgi:hypothetical protein
MIKKFESFQNKITFDIAYSYIRILNDNSYYPPEDILYKYLPDKFFGEDFLTKELSEIHNISEKDKELVLKCYHEIDRVYSLKSFPDYFKLEEYFLRLMDIKDVSGDSIVDFTILMQEKMIKFTINTIPSVRYFMDKDKTEFEIEEWDSITQEILPICERIKSSGYGIKTYLTDKGRISILISL